MKLGIKRGGRGLVVVDAVEAEAEGAWEAGVARRHLQPGLYFDQADLPEALIVAFECCFSPKDPKSCKRAMAKRVVKAEMWSKNRCRTREHMTS